ncbi:hypothetical protein Bca4012_020247 [Brassica carinata]
MEYYEGIPVKLNLDEDHVIVNSNSTLIDDGIGFWNGVIAAENNNNVKDEQHSDEMDLDIPMSQINSELQPNGTNNVDDANSSTDSTPDLDGENHVVLSCEIVPENVSNSQPMYENPVVSEGVLNNTVVISTAENLPQNSGSVDFIHATNNSPAISVTVGFIPHFANDDENLVINLDDSTSEDSMDRVTTNQHNELYLGMVFTNRDEFKLHTALYAIIKKFRFQNIRSAPNGMVLRCFSSNCQWRVYATKLKDSEAYEIRKLDPIHTCSVDDRSGCQSQVTHHVVGELMKARFNGSGSGPKPGEIRQVMQGDHDVRISYWKAWRSRETALEYAKGNSRGSYNLLPDYLRKLTEANPGTLAEIETEYNDRIRNRFKYMFLSMSASIMGFEHMRKVIVVDGTHLRGKYAGCLLTASAQDGNYQVFPLAIAIVDGENDNSWEWLFRKLQAFIPNTNNIVFVSYRHSSIYYGLAKVYPDANHCACILHLKRNIRTYYKDKNLGFLVAKAGRTYRLADFYKVFNEIKHVNPSCADYLIGIGFEHWARSHFPGRRYNIMTSNVAESWNAVLREAREYPILALVEFIRGELMSWFSTRGSTISASSDNFTPKVMEILSYNFELSAGFEVKKIKYLEYEVRNKEGSSFHVNISKRFCSCFEFQLLEIPCQHAIAAAIVAKVKVDSLVAEEYTKNAMVAAYAGSVAPVIDTDSITELAAQLSELDMFPTSSRRPPGRPRKKRLLSRGEVRMKTPRRRTICSRCKGCGHNRATCKISIG